MNIHFIGIGGIGVSALAKHYLTQGDFITGSDLASSEITGQLKRMGAKIMIGPHKTANLQPCARPSLAQLPKLIIYSPAINNDNPELKAARKWGIECQSYPEALGELTKKYFTIAVCGTHGKGTTTAMISLILIKAGFDPTVIIGTKLKEFGDSNYRRGKSKYLLIEADEYKASFLNYWPKAIVITTIDKDHLDYFKNLENIIKTFKKFIGHLPNDGLLIMDKKDKNSQKVIANHQSSITKKFLITNSQLTKLKDVKKLRAILKLPGTHIISDASAALILARSLKIPDKVSFVALNQYKGAWRRFEEKELKIKNCKLKIIQDYAHHPTEIKVTLDAVRQKYPNKQIWCVFQPHQYERTYYLFNDFIEVLSQAPIDKLILAPIYSVAGRESQAIKNKVNSAKLAAAIKKKLKIKNCKLKFDSIAYISSLRKISQYMKKNLQSNDILVIMGAGDIYQLASLMRRYK